jgi:DNA-binding beta-propeller fold protein YncE
VDTHGIITTVAGDGGTVVGGDGGPATVATLSRPSGLAFDTEGNLYVAATPIRPLWDNRIRKIDRQGLISTVAGNGEVTITAVNINDPNIFGDGRPALQARFYAPWGIAFDAAGNLFIAETANNRVRKVDTHGIITTIAGGVP